MNSQFKFHLFCAVLVFPTHPKFFRYLTYTFLTYRTSHHFILFYCSSFCFCSSSPISFVLCCFQRFVFCGSALSFPPSSNSIALRRIAPSQFHFFPTQHHDATFIFFSPKLSHFIPFLGIPIRTTQSHVVPYVEEDHLTVRRDFKYHQHKNRKSMVDCFTAQERRNRTCLRAIHQPFSRTKLLAASCSAAHCADFLVVTCLDREIFGHTLLQLVRPFSEKSSRPQFPIFVLEYFHRLKFFTNGMTLPV